MPAPGSLSHVAEFVDEINTLGAKYRARAFRDRNLLAPEKLKSVRWLFEMTSPMFSAQFNGAADDSQDIPGLEWGA